MFLCDLVAEVSNGSEATCTPLTLLSGVVTLSAFCSSLSSDFSKNRLDRIPDEVCNFGALLKLNCYHNSIRFVPEELSMLTNLKELDLR